MTATLGARRVFAVVTVAFLYLEVLRKFFKEAILCSPSAWFVVTILEFWP
jgi:hypothetical protein